MLALVLVSLSQAPSYGCDLDAPVAVKCAWDVLDADAKSLIEGVGTMKALRERVARAKLRLAVFRKQDGSNGDITVAFDEQGRFTAVTSGGFTRTYAWDDRSGLVR